MTIATGLPSAPSGAVTVYFLGPGFGESQVVVLPDARVVVVDGCSRDGINHPEMVLRALGRDRIDLLVLTHPDLDHLKGVGELVRAFRPHRVWRYPGLQTVRDELATQLLNSGSDRDTLTELQDVLRALLDQGDGPVEANFNTRPWEPNGATYRVFCLAPTPFDIHRALPTLGSQLQLAGSSVRVAPRYEKIYRGEARPGDHPNTLSLALVIEWDDRRILLAGDLENGLAGEPRSGWKGVRRLLSDEPGLGHLLCDLTLVKVAHHGSSGAFHEDAWREHALRGKTAAVISPFASKALPQANVLGLLRAYCHALGVSANGANAFALAASAGWSVAQSPVFDWALPCLVATVPAAGPIRFAHSSSSALFR